MCTKFQLIKSNKMYSMWLETVSAWNTECMASSKTLWMKRFFFNCFQRLKCKTFFADSKGSQIIAGHGKFKRYLCKLKLTDDDICSCGQDVKTAQHVLLYCKWFSCKRDTFRKNLERLTASWPPALHSLINCIEYIDVFKSLVYCLNI